MRRMDCNCFAGSWPFHRVRRGTLTDIRARHREYEIEGGYLSSTDAIFFNDPYEADRALDAKLAGDYRHVMTVNPLLPGAWEDIRRGAKEFFAAGVRIFPGFHGYKLTDPVVQELYTLLEELGIALFVTLRMEDDRSTYLFHPRIIPIYEIRGFLSGRIPVPTLLCNVWTHEMREIAGDMLFCKNAFADMSGFKEGVFIVEELVEAGLGPKLVYGSNAPILSMRSSLLGVETAEIDPQIKAEILSGQNFHKAAEALRI